MNSNRFYGRSILSLLVLLLASCSVNYQASSSISTRYPINANVDVDSSIIKIYQPYKVQLDAEMGKIIGQSSVLMSKKSSDTLPESLLSNFFADAVTTQVERVGNELDFAMPSTKGGLRVDLPKGHITVSNIFELMPFENTLTIYTLKGEDVARLLDFIAASNGQPVSGLRMKIVEKKATEVLIRGKPFDSGKTYKVLTTDYIAGGGDNTLGFENPLAKKDLNIKVRDALMEYVSRYTTSGRFLRPELDGRIRKK